MIAIYLPDLSSMSSTSLNIGARIPRRSVEDLHGGDKTSRIF